MSTVELSVNASIGDYYNLLLGREWKEFIAQQHSSVERLPVRVKNFGLFSLNFCGYLGQAFVISECLENRSFFSCSSQRRQKKREILKLDVYIHARFLVEMLQTLK